MHEVSAPQKHVVAALALIEARKMVRIAKYNAAFALADARPMDSDLNSCTGRSELSRTQGREEQLEYLHCLMHELEIALARCEAAKSAFEDACGNNGQGMAAALGRALQDLEG
jgi:hypothetical protein